MKEQNRVKNILELINNNLDKLDINRTEKSITNPLIQSPPSFKGDESFISSRSISSLNSQSVNRTFESMPFKEEKDLDLPYFSPTKYNSFGWRLLHSLTYFFYTILLLASTFCFSLNKDEHSNIIMLVSHICYFVSTFVQWFYYKRGCVGQANHNSGVKSNIDRSSKAKLLRSEEGWKYFFSLFSSVILIYGNIYHFSFSEDEDTEFWNINLVGCMIVSLSQILKLNKILTDNRQYVVKNDLSNCFVEIFLFFGSLFFGASYYIQMMYNYDQDTFKQFVTILKFIGNGFIVLSGISLIHRYFLSDYDDLNASDLSNITL